VHTYDVLLFSELEKRDDPGKQYVQYWDELAPTLVVVLNIGHFSHMSELYCDWKKPVGHGIHLVLS
jgi:hypothetical protein